MGIYDRHYYGNDDIEPLRMGWNAHSVVTKIIIVNVIVQLLVFFAGRNVQLIDYLELKPEHLGQPLQWYRFLSYGFTHDPAYIQHILFNMLSLFFLGRAVEEKYGQAEFTRFYLLTIVACGIFWAFMHGIKHERLVLIGASGATTAIAMLFVFSFPHVTLRLWGVLPVKAWVVGILIVGGNLIGNAQQVAYDVHLMGAGLSALYFFSKWNIGRAIQSSSKIGKYIPFVRGKLKLYNPHHDHDISPKTQREADRILEKLHREGRESLTAREEKFLEDYSRKVRKSRTQTSRDV